MGNKEAIIDTKRMQKLYMKGISIENMAEELTVHPEVLYRLIKRERAIEPEKWPTRSLRRKVQVKKRAKPVPLVPTYPPLVVTHHEPGPEVKYTLSREEIDRLYPEQKLSTNYDGKVRKAPIGLWSDGRGRREG